MAMVNVLIQLVYPRAASGYCGGGDSSFYITCLTKIPGFSLFSLLFTSAACVASLLNFSSPAPGNNSYVGRERSGLIEFSFGGFYDG